MEDLMQFILGLSLSFIGLAIIIVELRKVNWVWQDMNTEVTLLWLVIAILGVIISRTSNTVRSAYIKENQVSEDWLRENTREQ